MPPLRLTDRQQVAAQKTQTRVSCLTNSDSTYRRSDPHTGHVPDADGSLGSLRSFSTGTLQHSLQGAENARDSHIAPVD